ncbi:hypothetical protein CEXT_755331 [Caerostris extrusa]|uniref:Uncharacterized protein n=1 Tax=Caerostris extrusa TaxID=172846 RepID=A0AAV4PUZ1_CAEEX|nr:hypothetical protein CEXT_755331 [Caerostris extrusa]
MVDAICSVSNFFQSIPLTSPRTIPFAAWLGTVSFLRFVYLTLPYGFSLAAGSFGFPSSIPLTSSRTISFAAWLGTVSFSRLVYLTSPYGFSLAVGSVGFISRIYGDGDFIHSYDETFFSERNSLDISTINPTVYF